MDKFNPPYLLFHLTALANVKSIIRKGLLANDVGEIYLFSDMFFADSIARNQVFIERYGLFWVKPQGIYVPIHRDVCGELASPWQAVICQPLIEPHNLRYLGNKRYNAKPLSDLFFDLNS
jgi:hypothetical protein